MYILQKINSSPCKMVISGVLISGIWIAGTYVSEASEPHPLHEMYFSASTSDLTYTVSVTTGSVAILRRNCS